MCEVRKVYVNVEISEMMKAVRKRTLIINFHAYTGATEESVQLLSCPTGLDLV